MDLKTGAPIAVIVLLVAIGGLASAAYLFATADKRLDAKITEQAAQTGCMLDREAGQRIGNDSALATGLGQLAADTEDRDQQNREDLNKTRLELEDAFQTGLDHLEADMVESLLAISDRITAIEGVLDRHIAATDAALKDLNRKAAGNAALIENLTVKQREDIAEAARKIAALDQKTAAEAAAIRREVSEQLILIAADIAKLYTETDQLSTRADTLDARITTLSAWATTETQRLAGQIAATAQTLHAYDEALEGRLNGTEARLAVTQTDVDRLAAQIASQGTAINAIQANLTAVWLQLAKKAGNWDTLTQLKAFLASDTTDQGAWVKTTHDCDDFAVELARNALDQDKLVYPIPVLWDKVYYSTLYPGYYFTASTNFDSFTFVGTTKTMWMVANHMIDLAYTASDGWVLIEPQTDQIALLGRHEL